ncbi:Flp pilus assembly protein CpaB [Qipengyuania qiaonensis]|uniref:Flp pilus assembly protein CpaB n=1 Tax=Qipengyuania qiaonensis TaxID=2867240 RepID=A0ABS7J8H7_9SPHN|nr:Flp pilus assembly protein CpaB [Qipengyuania qiaonensis]MBX7483243.1 Flp pilus assembly protein CpaB [Qipengyuania qiaonensis]
MDRKKLVLLVAALIVAVGTALVARSMFTGASAPQAEAAAQVEPNGPKVLVAQRALPVGTIITADSIGFQAWPEELVQDAYFLDGEADISKLLGTVVRHPITAGEPVTQGSLVAPGDRGFLAAALTPGMRAITVPVTAQSGVAGFVFPGDRVDMVLTQQVEGEGTALKASETILRNLRVLATDQSTVSEKAEDGSTVVKAFSTVTIEVTPVIAEKVAVAQTIGTLSLSLRSLADNQSELERAIASGDVAIPDNATPEEEEKLLREAMSRPDDGKSTYVTGGDVSRFQRRTAPPQGVAAAAAPQVVGGVSQPVRSGPSVRVTRGKETEDVAVGASGVKAAGSALLGKQAAGVAQTANTMPAAQAAGIK